MKLKHKPYFRVKGKYKDGRQRIVVEWVEDGKLKSRALPKPEEFIPKVNGQVGNE